MHGDFNSKCRTCLKVSSTYYQLFDYVDENYKILDMLDGVVPQIDINTPSKFSVLICQSCVDKLLIGYKFQQLCIETNNRLFDLLDFALIEAEPEKILNPLTGQLSLNIKEEIEEDDYLEYKLSPNELEMGMESSNEINWFPIGSVGSVTDSSTKKQRKTGAQRQREYRQRQKMKKMEALDAQSDDVKSVKKKPKTAAQRQKEYRQRQKDKTRDELESVKKYRKKEAQRQKEFRQRQKWRKSLPKDSYSDDMLIQLKNKTKEPHSDNLQANIKKEFEESHSDDLQKYIKTEIEGTHFYDIQKHNKKRRSCTY